MDEKNIDAIVARLQQAKRQYYTQGNSPLSDHEFDQLEEELRSIAPEHPYFQSVGTPVAQTEKITHKTPMLSADKCKNLDELHKWLTRLALPPQTEFLIEPKIDGLSATCVYERGNLLYVATRGDGKIGQDVSHIAQYINGIPKKLPQPLSIEVRGELYLPQNTEFDTKGKPLRNNCVGLINRKDQQEDLTYVHFSVYQVLGDDHDRESAAIHALGALGFDIVPLRIVQTFEEIEDYYRHYLEELRYFWPYETDGLIIIVNDRPLHPQIDARWVVDHHHHYLVAFKPPADSKESILNKIEWQVSRQGNLIPVAIFAPIQLGGATLERASLHNAETVQKLCLAIGDTLLIERANDVIPYVKTNLSHHENRQLTNSLIPVQCPSCGADLHHRGVHVHCPNKNCPDRQVEKVLYWVNCCQMENIAEATIRQLFEKKLLRSVVDLYHITGEDLAKLEGFAEKKIENFLREIEKSRFMTAQEFVARLGIPLVQEKALQRLGVYAMRDFWHFQNDQYVIGRNLIAWRDDADNYALVQELCKVLHIEDVQQEKANLPQVCCTGSGPLPRNELGKVLASLGYAISDSVTKETTLLLCEKPEGNSSKLVKARKMNIPIQSYQEFFKEKGQLF